MKRRRIAETEVVTIPPPYEGTVVESTKETVDRAKLIYSSRPTTLETSPVVRRESNDPLGGTRLIYLSHGCEISINCLNSGETTCFLGCFDKGWTEWSGAVEDLWNWVERNLPNYQGW